MWTLCPDTPEKYDQCLEVNFPSDKTDDVALLNHVDGETTILKGTLMKELHVHLSVTVEGSMLTVRDFNSLDEIIHKIIFSLC